MRWDIRLRFCMFRRQKIRRQFTTFGLICIHYLDGMFGAHTELPIPHYEPATPAETSAPQPDIIGPPAQTGE